MIHSKTLYFVYTLYHSTMYIRLATSVLPRFENAVSISYQETMMSKKAKKTKASKVKALKSKIKSRQKKLNRHASKLKKLKKALKKAA